MGTELLPCPFCGSFKVGISKSRGGDERCGYNFTYILSCEECKGSVHIGSGHDKNGWCNEADDLVRSRAISHWNTRATPPNFIACHVDESCGQRDVPPAGGEVEDPNSAWEETFGPDYEDDSEPVEVAVVISTDPEEHGHYFTPVELLRFNKCYPKRPAKSYTIELVDRAHVTRLQAENADIESYASALREDFSKLTDERDALKAEVAQLESLYKDAEENMHHWQRQAESIGLINKATQSELTKARELLRVNASDFEGIRRALAAFHKENQKQWCGYLDDSLGICLFRIKELAVFLAHQTAPAAKGCTCGEPGTGRVVAGDLRPSFMDCPVHAPAAKGGE